MNTFAVTHTNTHSRARIQTHKKTEADGLQPGGQPLDQALF